MKRALVGLPVSALWLLLVASLGSNGWAQTPLDTEVAQVLAQNAPASVSVDANVGRHAINPNIYGFAFGTTSDLAATNFTMNRSGGNGTSTYNWQINAANHASDWYFESILDPPQTPGYDGDTFIMQTRAANVGAQPLLTIPMIDYLAQLGPGGAMLWSYSIATYGAQTGSDPYQPDAGNGISAATGKPITDNNPLDANTPNSVAIQQAWVQHLINTWGRAASGGLKYYIMDNEPSLWSSTHRDIHPAAETYNELFNDYVTYAGAVRALDPNAMIVGPEEWSWWALFLSGDDQQNGISRPGSDYNTHNHTYYYPWLLQQLYAYRQSTGKQLLNVLSVHYYPMELANSDDDSPSGQLTRNQSTRALWDPTYVDPSWFNQVGINGGVVNLIPTLIGWVNQYYPGLQTAITEYNWGDEAHLNGATTQADVLGIFGREGLDLATRWTVPVNPSPTYLAMEIYRNYDGTLSTFGDTSVSAAVANPDYLSSFAAVRSSDGALTVMVINKQQGSTPVTINLENFGTTGTAQAYQIASATQATITQLGSVPVANNAITATLPSQSITLFVIPAGNATANAHTLTVASVNPSSGVGITVSPVDNGLLGNGTTPFSRVYDTDTVVNVTAPATAGANIFQKWQRDGVDLSTSASAQVTMDADHTVTAVYVHVSFTDVPPSDPFLTWIEALFAAGITGGCATSPPQYCPDAQVTRDQMAVFLLRGIHGAGYQPPAATGTMFTDVPVSQPFATWIEQLAREGITGGCSTSPLQYCPDQSVTRGQMAVFLLRAKHGAGYEPPAATGTMFTDVPVSQPFAKWIEQLAREGITGGCGATTYCPDDPVTRGQMAVFLVRAFGLPL